MDFADFRTCLNGPAIGTEPGRKTRAVKGKRRQSMGERRNAQTAGDGKASSVAKSPSSLALATAASPSQRIVTYGSDCTGLGTDSIALHRILPRSRCKCLFASETSKVSRRLLRKVWKPAKLYKNMNAASRQNAQPVVDVYTCGPPCQPYSSAGKGVGSLDARCLLSSVASYICEARPKIFVIENVKHLISKKHKPAFRRFLKPLRTLADASGAVYSVKYKVLNTKIHGGIPQNRERVYVVGLRRDVASREFRFPPPIPMRSLRSILAAARNQSKECRPLSKTNSRNIRVAERIIRADGGDPSRINAIVDMGVGRKRARKPFTVDCCPTITRSRAAARDYWSTVGKCRLPVNALMALQGFADTDVPGLWKLSAAQVGGLAGNAMSVPVLAAVLREALDACDLL